MYEGLANNDTRQSVTQRPWLAHFLGAVREMGQEILSDSGTLKFLLSVTASLLVAMIIGAFTMTYFVTSHLASLETKVDSMSDAVNYRLNRDERQIDENSSRLNGRRGGP